MTNSSIKDNHCYGNVGGFLKEILKNNSRVSIVSAYFTIYAYHVLKEELEGIKHLRFLFGEPTFIKSIDPEKKNHRSFKIEDDQLVIPIEQRLSQKLIATECSDWITPFSIRIKLTQFEALILNNNHYNAIMQYYASLFYFT